MTTARLNPAEAVERYVRFWNGETPDEQRRAAAEVFTEDVEYRAVPGVLTGAEALIGFRTQFIEHVGAATYRVPAPPDHHHDRARFGWEIVLADGTVFAAGTDIAQLAPDGRITAVVSFLDRAPEGFEHHEAEAERAGGAR
ncbi:nuclear transport factor 2 family protein [Allonocardiopsis opalescens]|uniref:SnoaL-like protein n=1 Tax=Allonocardiopsis opalescens TaxID=1144618 RepID=A0A2T0QDD2_9ACTN|nr:nuclear transport factor 2 family protein [Allonocardiopsis opalescens]PRY01929.1 SnoaL-like protein [Allonocardiopsis opalescens]